MHVFSPFLPCVLPQVAEAVEPRAAWTSAVFLSPEGLDDEVSMPVEAQVMRVNKSIFLGGSAIDDLGS